MNETARRSLLELLADGEYHSGEELAARFGVSRTAVWKRLQRLTEELELELEARRGKGYRLSQPLELLSPQRIGRELAGAGLPRPSELLLEGVIDSTNRRLFDAAVNGMPGASACLAEHQTAGRGRRGRHWISPFGGNIYLSLLHRSSRGPASLGGLSIAAGLTAAALLRELGADELGVKWPNDLLWRGRKLGGLLVEVAGEQGGPSRAVLGIGINLRLSRRQGAEIDQPWVDLGEVLGESRPSRNRLAALLIGHLLLALERFEQHGLGPWLDQWPAFDLYRNQPVKLILGERIEQGICRGINEEGALLLEQEGRLTPYHGGEVSLRRDD